MQKLLLAILLTALSMTANAQSMNGENMTKQWFAMSNHQFIDDYQFELWAIKKFMRETYYQVQYDEFQLRPKMQKAGEYATSWLADYDDSNYEILTGVEFGSYDFDRRGYPLEIGISNNSYFYERSFDMPGIDSDAVMLSFAKSDNSIFENAILLMDSDKAQAFLNSKKGRHGYVNRELSMYLELAVISSNKKPERVNSSNSLHLILHVEIVSAKIKDGDQVLLVLK